MEETQYHQLANPEMEKLTDDLEALEEKCDISVEYDSGVLSVTMPDDREYIINKHTPSRQIWVSSPYTGASYFEHRDNGWLLKRSTTKLDFENLYDFITAEINAHLQ